MQTRSAFADRPRLYWLVGGAGSGKTTVCRLLAARYGLAVYDMDSHIYGSYHARFTGDRHPANKAWSEARDGLAWLLGLSWDEFTDFNRAALVEYLDLLATDVRALTSTGAIIDGGIINPALAAEAFPKHQMVCLAQRDRTSIEIWEGTPDREAMKDAVLRLPKAEEAWRKFLDLDRRITHTIVQECRDAGIAICDWDATTPVEETSERVARLLGL